MTRIVGALLVAAVSSALWPSPAAGKGIAFGRDIRVTCDPGDHAEPARKGSSHPLAPGSRPRPRPIIVGCASLPDGAGTVQLSALPHPPRAPFRGCVLDSYTVGRHQGGFLCAKFSRAFTLERRAVGLWITRLTPGGPSVALGAAAPQIVPLYLWYSLQSGLPGVTPVTRIPVGPKLALRLSAPAGFSYLAGALPPETDLCQGTLVGGLGSGRLFGPSTFLDTSLITRTEGDGNLTETPRSSLCARRLKTSDPLSALARTLSSTVAALIRWPAD
jgi:hypothetical protein